MLQNTHVPLEACCHSREDNQRFPVNDKRCSHSKHTFLGHTRLWIWFWRSLHTQCHVLTNGYVYSSVYDVDDISLSKACGKMQQTHFNHKNCIWMIIEDHFFKIYYTIQSQKNKKKQPQKSTSSHCNIIK